MIDWTRISELKSEVGEDDFAEVVEMFIEEVGEALEVLRAGDRQSAPEKLHFVKGSSLNIGLSKVSQLCELAENALREQPEEPMDFSQIFQAFDDSIVEFRATTSA